MDIKANFNCYPDDTSNDNKWSLRGLNYHEDLGYITCSTDIVKKEEFNHGSLLSIKTEEIDIKEEDLSTTATNYCPKEQVDTGEESNLHRTEKFRERPGIMNRIQKETMFKFVKEHPRLTGNFDKTFRIKDAQNLWKMLANTLNAVPAGAQKDWRRWRKSWHDLRSFTKNKERFQILRMEIGDPLPGDEQEAFRRVGSYKGKFCYFARVAPTCTGSREENK